MNLGEMEYSSITRKRKVITAGHILKYQQGKEEQNVITCRRRKNRLKNAAYCWKDNLKSDMGSHLMFPEKNASWSEMMNSLWLPDYHGKMQS